MKRTTRSLLSLCALIVGVGTATTADAKVTPEARRLMNRRDAERYAVSYKTTDVQAGAARVSIRAPLDKVRKVVTDYGRYSRLSKRFEKSRVVGRKGDQTDVYIQVPVLHGLGKIWAVLRFEPPKKVADGEEVITGRLIKGNVKNLAAKVTLYEIDDNNTQLNIELLIVPDLPVPNSIMTGEAKYAADVAAMGFRDRAEKLRGRR